VDERSDLLELVKKFEPEQRSLSVVVPCGVQDVCVRSRRKSGLRATQGLPGFAKAASISRRTSDHGRAAPGLA
jgi:hypothetical protein